MDENAIRVIVTDILKALDVPHKGVSITSVAGQTVFSIETDDGRSLIGLHGDTVHALDHLVKKIAEKKLSRGSSEVDQPEQPSAPPGEQERLQFLVDVNDYRARQIRDLETKALMMAERARSFQYDVELSPMSSYERLIIHTVLSGVPDVKTESQGEGRNRRVVIKYSGS